MAEKISAAQGFRLALACEQPLQIAGAVNAYCALLAEHAGFRALYLSGAGVANASFALADLGMTTLNDVCEDIRRITAASELPLLVDADTGFGPALMLARTVRQLSRSGAAAMHIEDQVQAKRCGHRPGKALVNKAEMVDRIKAAVDARDDDFIIMARTDAVAGEGLERALERVHEYVEAGADMIFAEALNSLEQYREFTSTLQVPVLANMTEYGVTPLYSVAELATTGVAMVLYPISAFRAMSKAAENVYAGIRHDGSQKALLGSMQTRADLYEHLGYKKLEEQLDKLFQSSQDTTDKEQ